jgi:hypothetical protein
VRALILSAWLGLPGLASGSPTTSPLPLSPKRLESLLQTFVDRAYLKAFRTLGDERDFDHGHFIFANDQADAAPVAILYHTQELAYYQEPGSPFGFVDPESRNWIQWIADGRIDNASRYERRSYPRSAAWDWFQAHELPSLRRHRTILADMLDPAAFGSQNIRSSQWVFTRATCAKQADRDISVVVPTAGRVCLSLSRY